MLIPFFSYLLRVVDGAHHIFSFFLQMVFIPRYHSSFLLRVVYYAIPLFSFVDRASQAIIPACILSLTTFFFCFPRVDGVHFDRYHSSRLLRVVDCTYYNCWTKSGWRIYSACDCAADRTLDRYRKKETYKRKLRQTEAEPEIERKKGSGVYSACDCAADRTLDRYTET